jgi:hypothetical protein
MADSLKQLRPGVLLTSLLVSMSPWGQEGQWSTTIMVAQPLEPHAVMHEPHLPELYWAPLRDT